MLLQSPCASHLSTKIKNLSDEEDFQFIQTYSLKSGLKKFGEHGETAMTSKMRQLHERAIFKPIQVDDMTQVERKRAMKSLIFLVEKHDEQVKTRTCANGSTQHTYMEHDDAASPTAMTESILITATIDAKQKRDVMTTNIPNAFVQTNVDKKNQVKGEHIIMKIRGPHVDMLTKIAPKVYKGHCGLTKERPRSCTSRCSKQSMACRNHPCCITRSFTKILSLLDSK
jgi:hypothetical protein